MKYAAPAIPAIKNTATTPKTTGKTLFFFLGFICSSAAITSSAGFCSGAKLVKGDTLAAGRGGSSANGVSAVVGGVTSTVAMGCSDVPSVKFSIGAAGDGGVTFTDEVSGGAIGLTGTGAFIGSDEGVIFSTWGGIILENGCGDGGIIGGTPDG